MAAVASALAPPGCKVEGTQSADVDFLGIIQVVLLFARSKHDPRHFSVRPDSVLPDAVMSKAPSAQGGAAAFSSLANVQEPCAAPSLAPGKADDTPWQLHEWAFDADVMVRFRSAWH